ncbi:hypothetical protein DTO212C5_1627 [Paecilomyces variotii]|nr:hypothetical protein DTO212C5_1627 [Paecilomyces variotii]
MTSVGSREITSFYCVGSLRFGDDGAIFSHRVEGGLRLTQILSITSLGWLYMAIMHLAQLQNPQMAT